MDKEGWKGKDQKERKKVKTRENGKIEKTYIQIWAALMPRARNDVIIFILHVNREENKRDASLLSNF